MARGHLGLKRKGEPLRVEDVEEVEVQKGRVLAKLSVRGADGRVFEMGGLTPETAEQARALVEQRREVYAADPGRFAVANSATPAGEAAGIPEQIRKLTELKDSGILTEEEFA